MTAVATPKKTAKTAKTAKTKKTAVDRAKEEMTDALKDALEEIRKEADALTDHDIEVRWKIGQKLNDIVDDDSGKYGTNPERLMKVVMPLSRDSMRPMMSLARSYSQADVTRLMSLRNPTTRERLTWSHVIALTRVPDKNKAYSLADKAVSHGWSSKDLNRAVMGISGKKSQGGRAQKKPKTLEAAAADVVAKTQNWKNAADKVWLAEGGLAELYAAESAAWPSKKPTPEIISMLNDAASQIDEMIVKARAVSHQLGALVGQAQAARASRSPIA